MRNKLISLAGIILLGFIQITSQGDFFYLFYVWPFVFLLVLYVYTSEERFASWMVIFPSVSLVIFAAFQTQNPSYLILIFISLFAFGGFFMYEKHWDRQIEEMEAKLGVSLKDKKALSERHHARVDSLKHLEERVNGLIHLFEIARDFNECISLSEILSALDRKISQALSFQRGTLILTASSSRIQNQSVQTYSFGQQKRADDDPCLEPFSSECIKLLTSENHVLRFDSLVNDDQGKFVSYQSIFPIWLFPLMVEHQLIAALVIEGGNLNDFQKFEILASQLSLQVKKVQLYETVREISIIDGLTQVFVRRHFFERFSEELKRALRFRFPISVLMVDVDHFKSYNDKFGHLVGDKTLREVAQVIRENVRRVDVIGRYGGEEFIVVAPEIGRSGGIDLAERIRSAVAKKKFQLYDEEAQITVSVGVSSFPENISQHPNDSMENLTRLIDKADEALYRAKQEGRNRVMASI